jgi:hypothetical protein
VKLRRARSTTSLLNEKPIEAWFEPPPRPEPPPRSCKPSCCKTPYGCAKTYTCTCHPKETQ